MVEFLFNRALSDRIHTVVRGRELQCAVAFWTEDGVDDLFPEKIPYGTKLLVDIRMGGTSPAALTRLGAPNNRNLRHSNRMHAKVFLSSTGLVVGSANSTGGALRGRNTEAGTFHPAGATAWQHASRWFRECFSEALSIGPEELKLAELLYRPEPAKNGQSKVLRNGSLLDIVRCAPWRFANVGFVFSGTATTALERAKVRKAVLDSGEYETKVVNELRDEHTFYDWKRQEIKSWPEYFFRFGNLLKSFTYLDSNVSRKTLSPARL